MPVRSLQTFLKEGIDHGPVATFDHSEPLVLLNLIHKAHTTCAHNAAISVEKNVSPKVVPPEYALWLFRASVGPAFRMDIVLEVTLPGHITDRAIKRMIH